MPVRPIKNGVAAGLSSAQTIGMFTDEVPGSYGYVQEAFGSIQARSDTVTVTENDYWPSTSSDSTALIGRNHWSTDHWL
jgi:hypothetical protein